MLKRLILGICVYTTLAGAALADQPTPYTRQHNFTDHTQNQPDVPHDGGELDDEFNALKNTLDETLTNLELIQRDDGELANDSVGADQIQDDVTLGINPVGDWATATDYGVNDAVWKDSILYRCIVAHTSGTFATDLAAAKWTELVDFDSYIDQAALSATNAATSETNAEASAVAAAASAASAADSAESLFGTSLSTVTIGTGTRNFVTQENRIFIPGTWIIAVENGGTAYVHGQVLSYSGGNLSLNATNVFGSGTFSAWIIIISGTQGPPGDASNIQANAVDYSNGVSGLAATDVQAAIDEVAAGAASYTVTGQTALTGLAVDDFVGVSDTSDSNNNKKITVTNFFNVLDSVTADTSPDVSADKLLTYDASATTVKSVVFTNLLKGINSLTEDTSPDISADFFPNYDASATAMKKVSLASVYKQINTLSADTSPDVSADKLLTYDASAAAAKTTTITDVLETVNNLTEDTTPSTANDFVLTYDASATTAKKVKIQNLGVSSDFNLVSSQTASGSSSLDFTNLSSSCSSYQFVFSNIRPSTDNTQLWVRTSTDNGVSYDSGASDYRYSLFNYIVGTGSAANNGSDSDSKLVVASGVGNAANESVSGQLSLYSHAGTANGPTLIANSMRFGIDSVPYKMEFTGTRRAAADVDAIRFIFSSGNITSGTIYQYCLSAT